MIEVGLWVRTQNGDVFCIKKDAQGHPDLLPLSHPERVLSREEKKQTARAFYEQLTGGRYPHDHAAMRQVLWDFLERAIRHLP